MRVAGTADVIQPFTLETRQTSIGVAGNGRARGHAPDGVRGSRAVILGCPLDRLTLEQAVAFCERIIDSKGSAQHLAVNAAKLVAMHKDEYLRAIVDHCDLVTADGQSVVWASRLLGDPVPARVAGIDLMHELLARAAVKGYRVYVLGAKADVLERAVARMCEEHPGLNVVGFRDGYYSSTEGADVAASIALARPDILFVAMSSPRKEYFLARYRASMNVPFVMGVGGAIDVVAGVTRRAPEALQRMGLEWSFRLAQEPRRLASRYLVTNTQFALLLLRALVSTGIMPKVSVGISRLERSRERRYRRPFGFAEKDGRASVLEMPQS